MVELVALFEPAQDGYRILDGGLVYVDRLEAPCERGVVLNMLLVLFERSRADDADIAARESGLEHVGRVHGALGGTRADECVHFVNKKNYLAFRAFDFFHDRLEPLLEFAAVFGPRDEEPQVELDDFLAPQRFGDIGRCDTLCKPFGHGGLADAGLADEYRIVLGAARKNLYHARDLGIAPDDGVELILACALGKRACEFRERTRLLRSVGVANFPFFDISQHAGKRRAVDTETRENVGRGPRMFHDAEQEMLG